MLIIPVVKWFRNFVGLVCLKAQTLLGIPLVGMFFVLYLWSVKALSICEKHCWSLLLHRVFSGSLNSCDCFIFISLLHFASISTMLLVHYPLYIISHVVCEALKIKGDILLAFVLLILVTVLYWRSGRWKRKTSIIRMCLKLAIAIWP